MNDFHSNFLKEVSSRLNHVEWHGQISHARNLYNQGFAKAVGQFKDLGTARRRAAHIRWKSINDLEKYLIQFESTFIKSGGKVIWARDGADACKEIMSIIQSAKATSIIKSKSLTGDEIGLQDALKKIDRKSTRLNSSHT